MFFSIVVWLGAGVSIQWRGDYDQALAQAKSVGKVLMVLVVEPASPDSNHFLTDMRAFPDLIDRVNRQWISVIVTHDHRSDYPNELYYTTKYPTLFWVDPLDERFVVSPKYGTPEALKDALDVLTPSRKNQ